MITVVGKVKKGKNILKHNWDQGSGLKIKQLGTWILKTEL